MLGLTHLAIPYYEKVFNESSRGTSGLEQEDLIIDTAYNLQTLYAMAGNSELAEDITIEWLVI
jgi:general transcription factor 3C polypeptide 3 (transcription factor C subunit 4)